MSQQPLAPAVAASVQEVLSDEPQHPVGDFVDVPLQAPSVVVEPAPVPVPDDVASDAASVHTSGSDYFSGDSSSGDYSGDPSEDMGYDSYDSYDYSDDEPPDVAGDLEVESDRNSLAGAIHSNKTPVIESFVNSDTFTQALQHGLTANKDYVVIRSPVTGEQVLLLLPASGTIENIYKLEEHGEDLIEEFRSDVLPDPDIVKPFEHLETGDAGVNLISKLDQYHYDLAQDYEQIMRDEGIMIVMSYDDANSILTYMDERTFRVQVNPAMYVHDLDEDLMSVQTNRGNRM